MFDKNFYISRRCFLKTTGLLATATSLPAWVTQECIAQDTENITSSPNEAIQIGLIGCGGQGTSDARNAKSLGAKISLVIKRLTFRGKNQNSRHYKI